MLEVDFSFLNLKTIEISDKSKSPKSDLMHLLRYLSEHRPLPRGPNLMNEWMNEWMNELRHTPEMHLYVEHRV